MNGGGDIVIYGNGHRISAESRILFLMHLRVRCEQGMTNKEFEDWEGDKDNRRAGWATGASSTLDQWGMIRGLVKEHDRDGARVYVLPEYVNGREVEPHKKNKKHPCPSCRCGLDDEPDVLY